MHEQQLEIIFENLPVEESLNRFIAEIMFDTKHNFSFLCFKIILYILPIGFKT
jgi:hypothetical protein